MARTELSTSFDRSFGKEVDALQKEGEKLAESFADLAERRLLFAEKFNRLWEQAQELDGSGKGEHHNYLRDALSQLIETSNESIRSRWVTIGSKAQALLKYKNALPPYRDSLYELALAVDEKEPVADWVKQRRITAESSVRDVRLLRSKKTRRGKLTKKAPKPARSIRQRFPASVTLSFVDFKEAARALVSLLLSDSADFKVTAAKAFLEDIRSKQLSDEDYERAKAHFS